MTMRIIRKSTTAHIEAVMELSAQARGIMRASGNVLQWADGYPQRELFLDDIDHGNSYLMEDDGVAVGAFTLIVAPDPTYAKIYHGAWVDDEHPYGVVHRICSRPQAHGVFSSIMEFCFAQIGNVRIDTHRDNHIMRHLLARHGFHYCGIIYLSNGDERLAFQKVLPCKGAGK